MIRGVLCAGLGGDNDAMFGESEMKQRFFIMALLVALSGCASNSLTRAERNELYAEYIKTNNLESQDKITTFKFRSWRSLSNDYLIITTSPQRRYLIKLRNSCINLSFSNGIVINQHGSQLHAKFDAISPTEFPEQKCFIKSIYPLTREQAVEMGRLGKDIDKTAES